MTTTLLRGGVPIGLLAALAASAYLLDIEGGPSRDLALSLLFGSAFGIVLQRSRFCFLCNFRDFVTNRDPRGLIAILIALATGAIGYALVFGSWMPVATPGRLPPDAHIGPISWVLPVASLVFGLGMALSGSCLSAHLYRLGEGSIASIAALVGALAGFGIGFSTWNSLFLLAVAEATPVWLPHSFGYAGSLALTLALLAVLGIALLFMGRRTAEAPTPDLSPLRLALRRIFVERWPASVAGVLVGAISTLAYFRVAPLGVTAELGSIARTAASQWQLVPETLYGLDGFRGCATAIKQSILSNNGMFISGIVVASLASAIAAGQFRPARPSLAQLIRNGLGGVLMGWGAMTALGCTVGVLLSGIHAGALAGWIFLVTCTLGVWLGLKLKKS